MKDGDRGRPIENYGKKEHKELPVNTLPDPHPCTAWNKAEEQCKNIVTGLGLSLIWECCFQYASFVDSRQCIPKQFAITVTIIATSKLSLPACQITCVP